MKEEITLAELKSRLGITYQTIAIRMGVSNSLISKIKNSNEPISADVQDLFRKAFGKDYTLVNGAIRWKDRYEKLEEKYKELEEELKAEKQKVARLKFALGNIKMYASEGDEV